MCGHRWGRCFTSRSGLTINESMTSHTYLQCQLEADAGEGMELSDTFSSSQSFPSFMLFYLPCDIFYHQVVLAKIRCRNGETVAEYDTGV